MATRDGTVVDVSPGALPSVLEAFGFNDPMGAAQHSIATIRLLIACEMPPSIAAWAVAPLVSVIASPGEKAASTTVSDEEYLLELWDAVATFLAESHTTHGDTDNIGVVVGLAAAQHWRFLQRRLRACVCSGRAVRLVVLVPTGTQKALAGLQPLLLWEREMQKSEALRPLNATSRDKTTEAIVLQVKTSKLVALAADTVAESGPTDHVGAPSPVVLDACTPMRSRTDDTAAPSCSPGVAYDAAPWTGTMITSDHLTMIADTVGSAPSRVVLISGPTGCGKSTKVPMALVDADPHHVVWVAQPRRVAAVSLCRRMHVERGNTIDAAYIIGGSSSEPTTAAARMVFMTSGVMLQRVKGAFRTGQYLKNFQVTHIILDEVHERTVEYDLLLCMLRELLKHHTQLRLILTSATMSAHGLQGYVYRGWSDPHTAWPPSPTAANLGPVGGALDGSEGVCEGPYAYRNMYGNNMSAPGGGGASSGSGGGGFRSPQRELDAVNVAVPIVSIPILTRRRKTYYIEDALHQMTTSIASASASEAAQRATASGDGRSPSEDAGRWEHVFHDPKATIGAEETVARDALSEMKLPFNVHDVLVKPQHRGSLVWEARFRLAASLVRFIHLSRPTEEAILVFLSGIHQLEALRTELEQLFAPTAAVGGASKVNVMQIHLLHSTNDAENRSVFETPPCGVRKVLIATNIAESSLTIPDVDHVVDGCVVKDQRFLHDEGLSMLEEVYCSKDSCEQRAGRTGRVRPGTVWRLVTKAEYEQFDEGRTPGILQTPLTTTMLLASDANVGEMDRFVAALPTPPPLRGVLIALRELTDHYGALMLCQARGNSPNASVLQPTCKGLVMGALGVSVPVGQLVVLGVACGITPVVVQAAAILSTTAPLLCDDANARLADFDHGTGCDVVACIELYRWCMRQRAPFARPLATAPVVDGILRGVRTNVLHEVGAKSRDLVRALAQYGLAQPLAGIRGSGRGDVPRVSDDVAPLTAQELMFLIAVMTMSFPNRTAAANDLSARFRSQRNRDTRAARSDVLFTPAHRVSLVQRSPVTHADEERIAQFLEPATCTIRRLGDAKLMVDINLERAVDAFGEISDDHAFRVRNVRNITYDAYRLMKATREERRVLNIAYADSEDDVHLLSSWFVPCKPALFVDRTSVLYPLVFDISVAQPPTVVSCSAVRRENRVALLSNLLLPGSLSVLPLALVPVPHWDGRSQDSRQCLMMPTLPHCHPSVKHLKRTAECLLDDVATLNSVVRTFFNDVLAYCSRQEFLSAVDGCVRDGSDGGASEALTAMYLEPAYEAVQHKAAEVQRALGRILCVYLRDVPFYYCPSHVSAFIALYAPILPSYIMSQPHVERAVLVARQPKRRPVRPEPDDVVVPHQGTLADTTDAIPLPSTRGCQSMQQILAPTHRGVLSIRQIAKYQYHMLRHHVLGSATTPALQRIATAYGIVVPHGSTTSFEPPAAPMGVVAQEEGDAMPEWVQRIAFPRPFAKTIPMDATCAAVGGDAVRALLASPPPPQRSTPSQPTSWVVEDAAADDSCGALLFHMVVRAVQYMQVRTAILCSRQEWTRELLATNLHTVLRHMYPTAGALCQWRVVLDDGAGCGAGPLNHRAATIVDPTTHLREGDLAEVVYLAYMPPVQAVTALGTEEASSQGEGLHPSSTLLPHEARILTTTAQRIHRRGRECRASRRHLMMLLPSDRSEACRNAVTAMLHRDAHDDTSATTEHVVAGPFEHAMALVGSYDDAMLQPPRLELWHGIIAMR